LKKIGGNQGKTGKIKKNMGYIFVLTGEKASFFALVS